MITLEQFDAPEPPRPERTAVERQAGLIGSISRATHELSLIKPEYRAPGYCRFDVLTREIETAVVELRQMGREAA